MAVVGRSLRSECWMYKLPSQLTHVQLQAATSYHERTYTCVCALYIAPLGLRLCIMIHLQTMQTNHMRYNKTHIYNSEPTYTSFASSTKLVSEEHEEIKYVGRLMSWADQQPYMHIIEYDTVC